MHGLVLRAVQLFVEDCYGADSWNEVVHASGHPYADFEAMLAYDDEVARAVISALDEKLENSLNETLEDLGTYLVSNPRFEPLRRLLRFGGESFEEFVYSLEDLRDRARLAVQNLDLPQIELSVPEKTVFILSIRRPYFGIEHVLVGLLRAMADDYGALALVEHDSTGSSGASIKVSLLETTFAEGREFRLGERI